MRFEFTTASRIVFGPGSVQEVPQAAVAVGRRALLASNLPDARREPLRAALEAAGVSCVMFAPAGEPTVDEARQATQLAREEGCQMVIAMGGGSAIDLGKAVAALLGNGGDPLDYLEVIGRGKPLRAPSCPWIAIPTTAGTGSEVTRNAVLASPEHRLKASLRGAQMMAHLAVVDPELALGLPQEVTAATGMDALTQLIEPYVSRRANPMTDLYCREGIRLAAEALPRAWGDGEDLEARSAMAMASLLGGMALANAGLGAVHGLAAPIGGMFHAPHGAVCAALLPHAMRVNIGALRARAPEHPALRRYSEIAGMLSGKAASRAEDGVEAAQRLCERLAIPRLRVYGVGPEAVAEVVSEAARASSMKANPIVLTAEELAELLRSAI